MLQSITQKTFLQLIQIIEQLDKCAYTEKVKILNGSSIGQHVRHVIEFYICLSDGLKSGIVNYDQRKRNISIENDPNYALDILENLSSFFALSNFDNTELVNITVFNGVEISAKSSQNRELVYLIEHSIHHYAIINIALKQCFPCIRVPEHFGVAYSTTEHKAMELQNH